MLMTENCHFSIKTYVVGPHLSLVAIQMCAHNIHFYGEIRLLSSAQLISIIGIEALTFAWTCLSE